MTNLSLPPLTLNNAALWHRALQALAHVLELETLLDAASITPEDPAEYAEFKRKQERLTLIILTSLPEQIIVRLAEADLELPPPLLTQHILKTVNELNPRNDANSLPKSKAHKIRLKSLDKVEDYITDHENMRIIMRNQKYPRIEEEATTIQFMINGIKHHPDLFLAHQIMVQIPPQTIAEFSTRLRRAVSDIQARAKTNASHANYQQLFPRSLPYSTSIPISFQRQRNLYRRRQYDSGTWNDL